MPKTLEILGFALFILFLWFSAVVPMQPDRKVLKPRFLITSFSLTATRFLAGRGFMAQGVDQCQDTPLWK